ncbi:MAG: biotin/lipoate A/B protein ligase family protein [Verrucomicrobiales bacterium]
MSVTCLSAFTATTALRLWIDDVPRDGPHNMALDEALLLTEAAPVLRVYRWAGPWVSIGYFTPRHEAKISFPDRPIVRRWTGGGIVDHASDWTYSLIVPAGEPLASHGTVESYTLVHGALVRALRECGVPARLADASASTRTGLCFAAAVRSDVVDARARKIAGAAQRRTRHGLLHQGSVQGTAAPNSLATAFALALAAQPPTPLLVPSGEQVALADTLTRQKYATAEWIERR